MQKDAIKNKTGGRVKGIVRDWNVKWKNARRIEGKVRKQRGKVGKKKKGHRTISGTYFHLK